MTLRKSFIPNLMDFIMNSTKMKKKCAKILQTLMGFLDTEASAVLQEASLCIDTALVTMVTNRSP